MNSPRIVLLLVRMPQLALAAVLGVSLLAWSEPAALAQGNPGCVLDSWTIRDSRVTVWLRDVAYGTAGGFVAAGDSGVLVTSPDGERWTSHYQPASVRFARIRVANGQYIAMGRRFGATEAAWAGLLWTSPDGRAWTPRFEATNTVVNGVAAGNGMLVAIVNVTSPGAAAVSESLVSEDGVAWTTAGPISPGWMYDIAFGNGVFVAIGGNRILASGDGASWTAATGLNGLALQAITFHQGQFIAVGDGGAILTSADGLGWTARVSGTASFLGAVAAGGGQVAVAGNDGVVFTSPNGVDWELRHSISPHLRGLAYGADRFVAAGQYGAVIQSGSLSGCGGPRLEISVGAEIRIDLSGTIGVRHRIEYIDRIGEGWKLLREVDNLPGSPYGVIDPSPSPTGQRFYRAVELP